MKGIYTCCWPCTLTLTLCMVASWSRDGAVFLTSCHLIMSSRLPCPSSTDAHWPLLGAPFPPPLGGYPFPQGPRTLPFQGPTQLGLRVFGSGYKRGVAKNICELSIFVMPPGFVCKRKVQHSTCNIICGL
jgi:hypothetical protein